MSNRKHRLRRRRSGWQIPALLGIGLALLAIYPINARLRPIVLELSRVQINNEVMSLLHQAVEEAPLPYEQIVKAERDGEGKVTLLKSDMGALQAYRSKLVGVLLRQMETLRRQTVRLPLGSLLGSGLLSGLGPKVTVRVLSVGEIQSDTENSFTDAGINQTRHEILLDLTASVRVVFAGRAEVIPVRIRLPLAETVIVGAVPEHFTCVEPSSNGADVLSK